MTQTTIIELAALAGGMALLFLSWRASNAPVEQVSGSLTGRFSGSTMWCLVGEVIGVVAGCAMLVRDIARA